MNDRERSKLSWICSHVAADLANGKKVLQFVRSKRVTDVLIRNSTEFDIALDALDRAVARKGKNVRQEAEKLVKSSSSAEATAGRSLLRHLDNSTKK
jgi:uncharacterized protein (DUF39 family)